MSRISKVDVPRRHVQGDKLIVVFELPDSFLLVKLKDIDSMSNMYTICRNEGFSGLNIHHVVDERIIWIEISGLPLCAWGSNAYKKIACSFGKFLFFEKEDSSALSSGRVCISSKSHGLISENVQVEINNELFEATVQEIGSWCFKIINDYIDLSLNDNIKDMDTSSESIDDRSVDDLEYIQTNLNNIDNQVSEQKMDNNEENKQGEEDIHSIVPQQPPKEEANYNESNPECKAESSDLSRPPSFEFMKKVPLPLVNAPHHLLDLGRKISKLWNEEKKKMHVDQKSMHFLGVHESKMARLDMARGLAGGLISMWDPNLFSKEAIWCDDSFIIIKGNWKNVVEDCYMMNIYGSQDQVSKLAL
ncbi:hypothetical protein Tco_0237790 [Tanacetum coccineum]